MSLWAHETGVASILRMPRLMIMIIILQIAGSALQAQQLPDKVTFRCGNGMSGHMSFSVTMRSCAMDVTMCSPL